MTTEEKMILENQVAIMTALIALLPDKHRAASELYYYVAKTQTVVQREKR